MREHSGGSPESGTPARSFTEIQETEIARREEVQRLT